ncbi:MAG: aminotransferase class III-fold pyridoxal phosphate-dependent enzyme, partial [Actinobacteria bacterium]
MSSSVEQRTESARIVEARERYVTRGVATPPLVVARAEGARIWDVDGREYVDFAGGLGC